MRSVLVTGVSTGIGKSIAEELLNSEFIVIGSVRNLSDAENLKENHKEHFFPVKFDVTKKDEIQKAKIEVEKILSENNCYLLRNGKIFLRFLSCLSKNYLR